MRDSGRPLVGHNCSFDISYVLAACAEPRLPPTWPGVDSVEIGRATYHDLDEHLHDMLCALLPFFRA